MKRISFIFLFILFAFTANAQDEPRFAISGDKVVCTLTTTEYTVSYEPPLDNCSKSTSNWVVENAGNATKEVSQDGFSCKVTWDPYSTDAKIKFTANYDGGCDSETVELAVQVGIGNVAKINFPASVIAGSATPVEFSVTKKQDVAYLWEYAVQPQTEWRWASQGAAPGNFVDISVNTDANKTVVSPGFNSQNMFVRVQKNGCVDIDIYDQMGIRVQEISTKDKSATIREDKKVYFKLNNLPTGKYTIVVDSPRGKFSANMIVKYFFR